MNDMINKSFNELGEWAGKLGLHPVSQPSLNCDTIASIDYKSLQTMELTDFEELINRISSYNIYVKSQKASIEAQIEIIGSELSKTLYLETNNLPDSYRYKSPDERVAVVRTTNREIDETSRKLSILKGQFARIKDMPFAIDKKIEILRSILSRRIANECSKH